jgi:hypothetical protein
MLNNLSITKSENQTAIAEFYLSQKCGVIDYFQYTGKRVEIYAVFENETKPLFKGWINTPEYDFYTKSIKFNATNEKIQQIANLDWNVINSIGYYSKRLFPDLETKDEIFNKRIESVKKSNTQMNAKKHYINFEKMMEIHYNIKKEMIKMDLTKFQNEISNFSLHELCQMKVVIENKIANFEVIDDIENVMGQLSIINAAIENKKESCN